MTMYTGTFNNVSVSALQDFFEIKSATNTIVKIHGWSIGQTSDAGDAQEELLRLEAVRGNIATAAVSSGTGGSTSIPNAIENSDQAFGGTFETNNTTRLSAGSPDALEYLEYHIWNVRVPITMIYTPEMRPSIGPGCFWTLGLPSAPADALTVSGTIWFEELG